jgi:hypothetical protein
LLDSAADGHDVSFSATAMNFAALNLSNVSLFTCLLSGGLLFSIFMLYFMPKDRSEIHESAAPLTPPGSLETESARLLSWRGLADRMLPRHSGRFVRTAGFGNPRR